MNRTKTSALSSSLLPLLFSLSLMPLLACAKKTATTPAAMTINGHIITVAEVEEAAEFFRRQQAVLSPEQLFEGGKSTDVRQVAARQLAANTLLLAEAKLLGLRADSARVEAETAQFIAQFSSREAFLSQLAAIGESEESIRRGMEDEFLLDSLLRAVGATAEPAGDEECRARYDANRERYAEPGMARASHIVFLLEPNATDSIVKAVMLRAKDALAKARSGANFDALVKEYSPQSGGDLGWFKSGDLVPDLERKIFSMKKGEISDPVPSSKGIHIIKKTDEKEPRQMEYAEAEAGIRAALTDLKRTERVNAYIDSLIGAADVKYLDSTLVMKK